MLSSALQATEVPTFSAFTAELMKTCATTNNKPSERAAKASILMPPRDLDVALAVRRPEVVACRRKKALHPGDVGPPERVEFSKLVDQLISTRHAAPTRRRLPATGSTCRPRFAWRG